MSVEANLEVRITLEDRVYGQDSEREVYKAVLKELLRRTRGDIEEGWKYGDYREFSVTPPESE